MAPAGAMADTLERRFEGVGPSIKQHRRGTHRLYSPARTLEQVVPLAPRAGVTRVANVTGLDRVGLPVVSVCRPNSRSLAVFQGKGLDLAAARTSGIMEALEAFHAEHIDQPLKLASWHELRATDPVIDVDALPRLSVSTFHPDKQTLWIRGCDLASGDDRWLPYETVHTNFSLPLPTGSGSFVMSSNGLASGNHPLEAVSHALCEVVERDANALWSARGGAAEADGRVDPSTVKDPDCRSVLDRFQAADLAVGIWDTTSDIGLAAFRAVVVDRVPNPFRQLYFAFGSGCHPVREIALARALTEAAQCRLTYIAGSRDDADRDFFERARNPDRVARLRTQVESTDPRRDFARTPTFVAERFADDVAHVLERLEANGLAEAVMVDLTRPDFGVPVVRVVVPGLESLHDAPGYVPGRRARAVLEGGAP